jgi:hypothetical protein
MNKNHFYAKYKDTDTVDKADVIALINLYENKIKCLKFLLNDSIEKSNKRYWKCKWNAECVKHYAKQIIRIYKKQLEEIPQKTFDSLDEYFKEIGYEESLNNFEEYIDSH